MKRMALSALVKQYGSELTDLLLSEVEIVDGRVAKVVETFVIEMVMLAYLNHAGTKVNFHAVQLVSDIAAQAEFDRGADTAEVEAMDLYPQAATTTILLPDGTIWFKDVEEGEDVFWCIHNPNHPIMPGHPAAKLA